MATTTTVIALTPEELSDIVERAVRRALESLPAERDVLTTEDVAKMLDIHPVVVRKWARERGLPATRLGREYRFRRAEVLAWVKRQGGSNGNRPA